MNNEQFSRALKSVGQTCFIHFFEVFSSVHLSRKDIIKKLMSETEYTEGSCISRTSTAQRIIREGFAKRAIEIVFSSDSSKISEETRKQAQFLHKKINK